MTPTPLRRRHQVHRRMPGAGQPKAKAAAGAGASLFIVLAATINTLVYLELLSAVLFYYRFYLRLSTDSGFSCSYVEHVIPFALCLNIHPHLLILLLVIVRYI